MNYTIQEHIFKYAAWAASRAASVINYRFSVEQGHKILKGSGLENMVLSPSLFPSSQSDFDTFHEKARLEVINLSIDYTGYNFSHGVAAKLINVYLKTIIICGGYHDLPNSRFVHPPIDRLLLDELRKRNFANAKSFWIQANKKSWSNFSTEDYMEVIQMIKDGLKDEALWKIEYYWKGYQ